jgi:DNA-binding LacI/PurR family transcriptional regulator
VTGSRLSRNKVVTSGAGRLISLPKAPIDRGVDAALETLFATPEPPTAILAMSDGIALFAMQWLAENGFAVPGDVSVVGFDGVPEAATAQPGLTTIAQPLEEIARRAASAILDDALSCAQGTLGVTLVIRGSTARPRS